MLKKAGMIAGVAAGLMIVGSPAFADAPNDLVLHDGGDTQVTHYVPIQIVDNHVPISSEEYVDGSGANHTNASNVLGGGGDLQESDFLPVQLAGNTVPISSYLEYLGSNADNSSNTAG